MMPDTGMKETKDLGPDGANRRGLQGHAREVVAHELEVLQGRVAELEADKAQHETQAANDQAYIDSTGLAIAELQAVLSDDAALDANNAPDSPPGTEDLSPQDQRRLGRATPDEEPREKDTPQDGDDKSRNPRTKRSTRGREVK
jgi:hypothetical protein